MSDGLARRLGYLGGLTKPAAHPAAGESRAPAPRQGPPGDGWEPLGRWTWRRAERVATRLGSGANLRLLGCSRPPEELLFYDTETTGLSGGAGSLAFLVGLARPLGGEVEIEQLFLADFPGEGEFLEALAERLFARPSALVSYNGKGFDSYLLRARFALAGIEAPFGEQIDLLYPVRRLWRRVLGECSLTGVAEAVLGIRRALDIPGAEVPDAYFEYLRRGDPGRLPLVFEHNRQDMLAMVELLARIESLLAGRVEAERVDLAALGSWLLECGDGRGEDLLRRGLAKGDLKAGRRLGLHYKRLRAWDEAVGVWELMAAAGDADAVVELAKHAEHRLRRPERALAWLDSAWAAVLRSGHDDAERRRRRLRAKVERSG